MKVRRSGLWTFLNNIAIYLPSTQPLIVDLLKVIRTLYPIATSPVQGFASVFLVTCGRNWADGRTRRLIGYIIIRPAISGLKPMMTKSKALKPDMLAAAQLSILSPRELFESHEAEDSVEGLDAGEVKGHILWTGELLELSLDRWNYWKERWQQIRDGVDVSDEVKGVAVMALAAMN
ncbi:hypothetical protein SUNI508_13982 [Seiridium unicorne]|uniref:Uncharacterized protein n=1 Tax=Seiridium unicorne TaxID=138068 RepID=A0ABR2V9Y7_9PEZI